MRYFMRGHNLRCYLHDKSAKKVAVTLEVSTPALLFPAISLLFLSFTNRFLHLAALIRKLHSDWLEKGEEMLRAQIENLKRRLVLIRLMQLLGAISLLLCVSSMLAVIGQFHDLALVTFGIALILMAASLGCLVYEVWISGGALRILLNAMENTNRPGANS
ncbi:DUF2721 domain-containing protein [Luteolibacter pohnpeiensis]|uniref:DUF2721 domain-containing protein n=1 Tax=Luteolibacter pohnpeiensis TaxID=454153 RepID=A0A934S8N3_9BACT|nr:DUF2721 domain-containing protein [Luteolibacter pohnpeiensis]MBK1880863.1 DUF2721 domain-containing protein [Luteolibacter pohnpeiensis]